MSDAGTNGDSLHRHVRRWMDWPKEELATEIRNRMWHFYGQTDGTMKFPSSAEGDLLKMVNVLLSPNASLSIPGGKPGYAPGNCSRPIWVDPPECPRCGKLMKAIDHQTADWKCDNHEDDGKCVFLNYELIMIMRGRLSAANNSSTGQEPHDND